MDTRSIGHLAFVVEDIRQHNTRPYLSLLYNLCLQCTHDEYVLRLERRELVEDITQHCRVVVMAQLMPSLQLHNWFCVSGRRTVIVVPVSVCIYTTRSRLVGYHGCRVKCYFFILRIVYPVLVMLLKEGALSSVSPVFHVPVIVTFTFVIKYLNTCDCGCLSIF